MLLEFTKMHGLGNDFIVLELAADAALPQPAQWRALAARNTGIGFDQALVVQPPRRDGTAAFYRVFNADGSEVEQCGNGARCVAALLHERGRATGLRLTLDSPAGLVHAELQPNGLVAVDMGVANFAPAALPFTAPVEALHYSLRIGAQDVEFGAVSMGNPHAVLTVPDVKNAPVASLGAMIEAHRAFPQRVNVGFMQLVDSAHINLRVFERGVGETQACGTGACAAVAVGQRHGQLKSEVEVTLPGGMLTIRCEGPGQSVWMTGPAVTSFVGRVKI